MRRKKSWQTELLTLPWNSSNARHERMAQIAYPVIKQVYETQGHMYENILDPHHRRKTYVQHLLQPEEQLTRQNVRRW